MKKIIMQGPKKSKVEEVEIPKINDDQLLVKVLYTGLCHSEWYPWTVAKPGEMFGHEPMGIVADVGKNVKGFKIGDRVSGLGSGNAEYTVLNPAVTVHVPDNVKDEDAVAEPLSCLLSAAARVPIADIGNSVAVVGAGYMGLGIISLLKLKGAGKIVAIDQRKEARENALKYGATEVYAPEEIPDKYKLDWEIWGRDDLTRAGEPVDIFTQGFQSVVEFTGTQSGLRLAGDLVSAHGFLGIGGYHNDSERMIDFKFWNIKAIVANSLHERRTDYQTKLCANALNLISSGQWKFTGLTTHIYKMEEFDQANIDMDQKNGGFIKGLIRCSE